MARLIDADNLKKGIAKLHFLRDEKEIRRLYYANPHNSLADLEEILVRIFDDIECAPTIDAVPREEFEQMRFLADKSMEMVGEPTWTDVLAELHERFSALEKEIRKASAEMSAIIREYVDRPNGEWIDEHGNRIPMTEHSAYCSHCGEWSEYLTDYCGNCGADMTEREDE